MRILYLLLAVLLVVLQGVAGQHYFPRPFNTCRLRNGICTPGICRRPYYWIGTCNNGIDSCCARYVEVQGILMAMCHSYRRHHVSLLQ
uniref:Beta-defensin-like domain-containing protein n=1 Tax=Meleagris gallopavo TaxID=9103 RepID=A0A803Y1C4_MELGA